MRRCTERTRRQGSWLASLGGAASACVLLGATSQCVTDHDALAKRERDAGPDAVAGQGGKGGSGSGGSGAAPQGGTAGKYVEPEGRNVVTFMHGVVDSEEVVFCFARDDDGAAEFAGEPAPASGLEFGQAFSVEELAGLDLEEDVVVPYVIGGKLELLEGLDCEEAVELAQELMDLATPLPEEPDDGSGGEGGQGGASQSGTPSEPPEPTPLPDPPALRARALPALPAGTLSGGFSYLLVAEGCLGGPWYVLSGETDDKDAGTSYTDDDVCGAGYSGGSSLAPALVVLSRETANGVGLQVLHASRATGSLALRVSPPPGSADPPLTIASSLFEGSLQPVPARSDRLAQVYGVDDDGYRVQLVNGSGAVVSEPWQTLLDRADLDTLENGQNYALVAIGPRADIGVTGFWNLPTIGLVATDP